MGEWVEPDDADEAADRLAMTLGIGEDRQEQRYHAAEVRRGLLSLLTGLASEGPVVLVFEDLQGSDPILLDLIEQLVKEARKVPLMVLCVARWEFLEQRPNWAGGVADAVSLWVEPLTLGHATELAMEAGSLHHGDAERVAQHAGGNPFFIVEIVGMLRREERDLPPSGPAPSGRLLPPTVQAVIAARIDQLTPAARELVRRAAVFPRGQFDLDELSLIAEPRKELLDEAENDELLVRDDDRPGVWRFVSDVLRDVAYDSLAKRERQRLHLRVANRLSEGVCGPVPADGRVPPRTSRPSGARSEPAGSHPRRAGGGSARRRRARRQATHRIAFRGRSLRAGARLGGSGRRVGRTREAWILSVLGEARHWLGEFDAAESALRRAVAIAGRTSDRVCAHASRFLADIALTVHGDAAQATALFDRSLRAARRLGEPLVLARTLLTAGRVPCQANDFPAAEAMFREALAISRSGERPDARAEGRSLVGIASVTSRSATRRTPSRWRSRRSPWGRRPARPSRRRSRTVRWRDRSVAHAPGRGAGPCGIGDPHVPVSWALGGSSPGRSGSGRDLPGRRASRGSRVRPARSVRALP